MDELCRENDLFYFENNLDFQPNNNVSFTTTLFYLLSIMSMSLFFSTIIISQSTKNELILEEEEEEEEIPYEEQYPLDKKSNSNKTLNPELCILEHTPHGKVIIKYNVENEGFDYWADYKEIPFNHLETVARKFVNTFNCTDLYLRAESEEESEEESEYSEDFEDEETENTMSSDTDEDDDVEGAEEESEEKEDENKDTVEEEKSKSPPDSDDEIFAKFKNTEKIKETITEEENQVINKFRYKGKLVDILESKQKKSENEEPKNVTFSSWKGIF
jgi:hypothetical protein